jgi:protein-S-isoprenylcysteine O-methyltransferase Ste14
MLKIMPPVWFIIFLALAFFLHRFVPISQVFDFGYPLTLLGIALFGAGFFVTLRAARQFEKAGTEILPTSPQNHALVVDGLYRYSRNPMYLGMVTMLLGVAFYVGTLPFFLAALSHFLTLNVVFIPFEEEKMERQFGESYRAYKGKVRRWL